MAAPALQPIRLADLDQPLPPLDLGGGRLVPILPLNGKTFQLAVALEEGKAEPDTLWQILAQCLPALTEDERLGLISPYAGMMIVATAAGRARQVLALIAQRNAAPQSGDASASDAEGNGASPVPSPTAPVTETPSDPTTSSNTSS